ncbi:MAG: hypothetical protein OXQ84_10545 [bacterium]|nr:hypothetical protein [bacterium]
MPSLFAGTDDLICHRLKIQRRTQLNDRTLRIAPPSDDDASVLVNDLYERMAGNAPVLSDSRSLLLWRCRHAVDIAAWNRSEETMLERAVAILANQGHMPGWFNQCPVASGIADANSDRKRAVDLVHHSGDTARLIELKWASNTPVHALFQILEYGLAYVLARLCKNELGLDALPLMQARRVELDVVGPVVFFAPDNWSGLFSRVDKALARFAEACSNGAWSMSVDALALPKDFDCVPFADGREVRNKCSATTLTREGHAVRHAFDNLTPAAG